MGMFRDMKDMMQTVRSDELKELKKKADAQPKRSMLEGVKMANAAYDDAMATQAGAAGMADPAAFGQTYMAGTAGTAIVNAIRDTGTLINGAPVCELDLTVTVPGTGAVETLPRDAVAPLPRQAP